MNARAAVFPLGREALSWVREGGKPDRASWLPHLMHRWQSGWFERHLALQRRLRPPTPLTSDPVFILGLWRSGTTFMHDLLAACPGMIYPATWQCMRPASFRLQSPPAQRAPITRPMDGFTIDALSPQEDEFALLALGIPSVYRGFFDPRRLPELGCWLDPNKWEKDRPKGWIRIWREFLAGVADGSSGRLVLKSPSHTFRIRALAEAFPGAAYIWIVREPAEVYFSNCKMWTSMFQRYALWDWEPAILDEFLCRAFASATQCLGWAADALPRERLVVTEFSRLTNVPLGVMEEINRRLGLGNWGDMKAAVVPVISGKSNYRGDSYAGRRLPAAAVKITEKFLSAQHAALANHGL